MTGPPAPPDRALVTGIVLAGGAGTRFGAGRSKAWLTDAAGDTLLSLALASLVRVARILVVVAPREVALPPLRVAATSPGDVEPPDHLAVHVPDLAAGEGPLAGLVPGLELAAGTFRSPLAFVLAVDMPRFTPGEFACLAAPLEARPGAVAVVPRTPRGLEPLFACVRPAAVAPVLRTAWERGERAGHGAFEALGPGLLALDTTDPAAWPGGPGRLRSINVPADLPAVLYGDGATT